MNAIDVMEDILKFRGFWKAAFLDKVKWLLVLYPFFLFVLLINLAMWIPLLPQIIKSKFKR